jgi:hypothetical protein
MRLDWAPIAQALHRSERACSEKWSKVKAWDGGRGHSADASAGAGTGTRGLGHTGGGGYGRLLAQSSAVLEEAEEEGEEEEEEEGEEEGGAYYQQSDDDTYCQEDGQKEEEQERGQRAERRSGRSALPATGPPHSGSRPPQHWSEAQVGGQSQLQPRMVHCSCRYLFPSLSLFRSLSPLLCSLFAVLYLLDQGPASAGALAHALREVQIERAPQARL